MKKSLWFLAAIFVLAQNVFAQGQILGGGSEAGNGGSAIVCLNPDQSIKSVELLDFYEGTTKRGLTVDLGADTLSVDEKIKILFERLTLFSPDIARHLSTMEQFFFEWSHFFRGVRLVEVPDSHHLYVPAGCQQEQIAIQRQPLVSEDKLYNINADLWDRLSNNAKAGLVFHEILYSYALVNGKIQDSQIVRYFVSKLASNQAASWELRDYVEAARKLGFDSVSFRGMSFNIDENYPEFRGLNRVDGLLFSGGPLKSRTKIEILGRSIDVSSVWFDIDEKTVTGFSLALPTRFLIDHHWVWAAPDKRMMINRFSEKAYISRIHLMPGDPVEFTRSSFYRLRLDPRDFKSIQLGFDSNGTVTYCKSCLGEVTLNGQIFKISGDAEQNESASFEIDLPSFSSQSIFLKEPTQVKVGENVLIFSGKLNLINEHVYSGEITKPTEITVGQNRAIFSGSVYFDSETHQLFQGTLSEDADLMCKNGTIVHFLKGMQINFEKDGKVEGEYDFKEKAQSVFTPKSF